MINFFRKIRKQLADDNKPLKYMRYAIGEILLVVIGILIALSVNNWNEQKKLKEIENGYLKRLNFDLNKDTEYWKNIYERKESQIDASDKILSVVFSNRKDTILNIGPFILPAISPVNASPNQITFTELLSGGNLNVIKNDSIKIKLLELNNSYTELINWDKSIERLNTHLLNSIGESTNRFMLRAMQDEWSLEMNLTITQDQKNKFRSIYSQELTQLLKNKAFMSSLGGISHSFERQLPFIITLEEKVIELILLIEKELNLDKIN